jgi:hypothetical protein
VRILTKSVRIAGLLLCLAALSPLANASKKPVESSNQAYKESQAAMAKQNKKQKKAYNKQAKAQRKAQKKAQKQTNKANKNLQKHPIGAQVG